MHHFKQNYKLTKAHGLAWFKLNHSVMIQYTVDRICNDNMYTLCYQTNIVQVESTHLLDQQNKFRKSDFLSCQLYVLM